MPSVSLTNAFDILELDVDVQLSLSGFANGCDGTYVKNGYKRWFFENGAADREIVYVNKSDNSPETRSYWLIKNASGAGDFYTESVGSAADHPINATWSGGGTISIVANQDVGGTIDIRDFTNLTSLNFSQVGIGLVEGNIFDRKLTRINLSGNGITQRFNGFPPNSNLDTLVELLISGNNFNGGFPAIPKTAEFINISDNDFYGTLPSFEGNSTIQKFVADRSQENSPLQYPIPIDCFNGDLPSLRGCDNLVHFSIKGNSITGVEPYFNVTESIYYFDVSDNDLGVGPIRKILKAFNEVFFEPSPQISVSGQGRIIDISGNQDFIDNSPSDSSTLTYISNLQSLGWTVTIV